MPKTSVIASVTAVLILTACAPMKMQATVTETTLCQLWGESLPTRSRKDSGQTQDEIGAAYADFAAACPDQTQLIP